MIKIDVYITDDISKSNNGVHIIDATKIPFEDGYNYIEKLIESGLKENVEIYTKNPYIIASVSKENVFLLKKKKWVNPDEQTFGMDLDNVLSDILNMEEIVPAVKRHIEQVRGLIDKTTSLSELKLIKKSIYKELGDSISRDMLLGSLRRKRVELEK